MMIGPTGFCLLQDGLIETLPGLANMDPSVNQIDVTGWLAVRLSALKIGKRIYSNGRKAITNIGLAKAVTSFALYFSILHWT